MENQQLINKSSEILDKLIETGAKSWTLHVPPEKTDPDLLFTDLSVRFQRAISVLKEAKSNFQTICLHSDYEENQVIRIIDHYECGYCGGRWYK